MALHGPTAALLLVLVQTLLVLEMGFYWTMADAEADCPLDLSHSNFTLASTLCSNQEDRGKCCRYINAVVAISVSQYANKTSNLGVTSDLSDICLSSVSQTFELYGVTRNAMAICGFGTKILVNYECQGRSNVGQVQVSPKFSEVAESCRVPLSDDNTCRKCLNAGILYLRNLLGPVDNVTLSTCRDATFAAMASEVDYVSAIDIASCFFGVQGLISANGSFPSPPPPQLSPISPVASSPSQLSHSTPGKESHHPYHLTVVPGIGVAVTALAISIFAVFVILIRRKTQELEDIDNIHGTSPKAISLTTRKFQDGPSNIFRRFSYREIKKATHNFSTVIGGGGFGIVYKGDFKDGSVAAVKRMSKVSEQAEDDFCRELELLARLHHRHLLALRGFCMERHERFLMFEFMANGSLKDHLHKNTSVLSKLIYQVANCKFPAQGRTPLSWCTRIQIAIDVANALEYLHFYCNPPLCHRDIKSSNILLDENFVAKVADFGLAHASKDGSICFEPVNTDIRGTPGYLDPEYVITQELTEKSDIYSYGVVLLELVTGRRAIQDNKNLLEWAQEFMDSESRIAELVDPYLVETFDFDELQTLIVIVKWCTQREGKLRPSIKQVLRLLYESSDPLHSGFVEAVKDEGNGGRDCKSIGKNGFFSGEGRCLASSSSTSRSYCSRSFLLEPGSPPSPNNVPSI